MCTIKHPRLARLVSWLLCCSLVLGALPASAAPPVLPDAAAVSTGSWADPYLDKLVSWGIMRGDQDGDLDPDRDITRAEYLTIVNRAYGYTAPGRTPFTDVPLTSWYADDIGIAYNAGYFTGTSSNAASPDETLTREQATVLLGRNLMLQEDAGESLDFTDSRDLSYWSRGIVKTAAEHGVVNGLPDGTFQPQRSITRGEVASLLVNAIGTPISTSGDYALGSVYGNVTISSSGVTLRNTTIAGDLYLTGGVGLGYVTLENVTVLGRIIASGAGEANQGDSSIILRNVTSQEMVVDSPANQYVTIRAEGDTNIAKTSVRTPSYLEDVTGAGLGLKYIELDGEPGTILELSGNIKEVVNLTPGSSVNLALGSAQKITVDEAAAGSRLNVAGGSEIKTLNLDTGTSVTGSGDIETLNINSNGSSVSMLPDNIVIRPGVSADVDGKVMDSATGAESSEQPKLLSGYPRTADIAPTSASALFSTNKSGTVYWAVSSITDGSVAEADLIAPPTYGSKILKSGSVNAASASTELMSKITGLTTDGSYYLSAMLVDSRDQRSPVKVVAFTTPDNSTPNFTSGYPVMTKIEDTSAQATVMTTKSCKLYYAVFPKGSTAPTPADFKANSLTGNLGFGVMDAAKNTTLVVPISSKLMELETYDLYFWLNDADGAKSSAVKKLTFTTVDRTPPIFMTPPTVNSVKATSVGAYAVLDEPGTIFWAVVPRDTPYPKALSGQGTLELTDPAAKIQVESGMNSLKSGKVAVSAANKDVTITISGLAEETAYDFYYVAKDKAGNYSDAVGKLPINTLDIHGPTATIEFTRFNGTDKSHPLADTDVRIIFNEGIQTQDGKTLVSLYGDIKNAADKDSARNALANALRPAFELYDITAGSAMDPVKERVADNAADTDWVIDYRFAQVTSEDGKTVVTFPTNTKNPAQSALNLKSGSTYYFKVDRLLDTATPPNPMGTTYLPDRDKGFTTVFAQMNIDNANVWAIKDDEFASGSGPDYSTDGEAPMDMSFRLTPVSTEKADDSILWDLVFWSDSNLDFDLYSRERPSEDAAFTNWEKVNGNFTYVLKEDGSFVYRTFVSVTQTGSTPNFEKLNDFEDGMLREYAVHVTKLNGSTERATWNKIVNMQVTVAAGNQSALRMVTSGSTENDWTAAKNAGVVSIGLPDPFAQKLPFSDSTPPVHVAPYPQFTVGDTMADMTFLLNREGTVYYVVTPVTEMKDTVGTVIDIKTPVPPTSLNTFDSHPEERKNVPFPDEVPEGGDDHTTEVKLSLPTRETIVNGVFTDPTIRRGSIRNSGSSTCTERLTDLTPDTVYYVYVIAQGTAQVLTPNALCYTFKTEPVVRPILTLDIASSSNVNVTVDRTSDVNGILMIDGEKMGLPFNGQFYTEKNIDSALFDDVESEYRGAGYTVLDALIDTYSGGDGRSVFDQYASSTLKTTVAQLIRAEKSDPNTTVFNWKDTLEVLGNAPTTQLVPCQGMKAKTWYCFLAVAKSPMGSGDAFRAVRPVQLLDDNHPMIIAATTTAITDTSDPNTLNGTLTVSFDEELYFTSQVSGKQTTLPVALVSGTGIVSSAWWPIGMICTLPGTSAITLDTTPSKVSTIVFDFRGGLANNSTFTIKAGLCDEWTNGIDAGTCSITLKLNSSGTVDVIITHEWDARPTQP